MLLLNADLVEYCQVMRLSGNVVETLSGVSYQEKLFTKVQEFPKDAKQEAIQEAKKLTLEHKGLLLILLLEEAEYYGIWQQNDQVKIKELKNMPVSEIDLEELVGQMRNVGGIRIEDRRYKLKTYSRCFVGSEAVVWLMRNLKLSKQDAIRLGQRLIDAKWIHHVVDDHPFEDDYLFYRFYWDEASLL